MFDNIKLKINNLPKNYTLYERLERSYKYSSNTYKGYIGNLKVYKNPNSLIIYGSLPKYFQGENITPLTREKIKQAVEKLEQDIKLDLGNAVICSVEFGTSIVTQRKPFEYLDFFGYTPISTRVEYSKRTGIETVCYTTNTGAFEFIGYDKIKDRKIAKKLFLV